MPHTVPDVTIQPLVPKSITGIGDGFTVEPMAFGDTLECDVIYIGVKARFVALANGVKLEVKDGAGFWQIQQQWTES